MKVHMEYLQQEENRNRGCRGAWDFGGTQPIMFLIYASRQADRMLTFNVSGMKPLGFLLRAVNNFAAQDGSGPYLAKAASRVGCSTRGSQLPRYGKSMFAVVFGCPKVFKVFNWDRERSLDLPEDGAMVDCLDEAVDVSFKGTR